MRRAEITGVASLRGGGGFTQGGGATRNRMAELSGIGTDSEYLHALVGYVSLVYHEARNVRHLIQCGVIEQDPWKLVVALPGNKYKAWRAIQDIRAKAEGSALLIRKLS